MLFSRSVSLSVNVPMKKLKVHSPHRAKAEAKRKISFDVCRLSRSATVVVEGKFFDKRLPVHGGDGWCGVHPHPRQTTPSQADTPHPRQTSFIPGRHPARRPLQRNAFLLVDLFCRLIFSTFAWCENALKGS